MSKLEELIQQYCPDGVEYKKLGEICNLSRGKVYSKSYIEENAGEYPVYSSQTANNGELGRISTYDYDGEYLTWTTDGAYAGTIFYRKGKFSITNVCGLISTKGDNLNIKFLFYWLSIKAPDYVYRGMGNPKLMSNQMEPIPIPVPPLPVQEEIVRILDNFAELQVELQAELQAELQKRLQQYNFYRDNLLSFEGRTDIEWKSLGDVCELGTGSHNTQDGLTEGQYPFYTRGSEVLYLNDYDYDETAIITAGDGAGVGKVFHFVKGKYALHQRAYRIVPNEKDVLPRYVYYYIGATFYDYIMRNSVSSSVVSIRRPMMVNCPIPVPPLAEQQRIVDILDRFHALTTDITAGLPAEIEARRKQYEYYRDQLLTFKQKA